MTPLRAVAALGALLAAVAIGVGVGYAVWGGGTSPSTAATASGTLIRIDFGPSQVWDPSTSPAALDDLHKCIGPIALDCVRQAMERNGGSPDAFEFYHLTGRFLTHLQDEAGPVKLASILNPWRANENEQSALVGGDPVAVYPEDVTTPVEKDPGFKAIQAQYPNLMFWMAGPTLESAAANDAGQAFVFRYRLLDGCHACPIRGYARIEFDFHPDGTYQGAKLLGVVPQ